MMEFGKVTPEELSDISFTLPRDHEATDKVLAKNPAKTISYYVGCAKWGRKDWVGKIYPKGTKETGFLSHYSRYFNTIELNATFYKLPTVAQTRSWAEKVGDDFRFCPKVSNKISHLKRLKDAGELTDRFLQGISGFGNKLGPVFLMIHPGMGPASFDRLEAFLTSVPKDIRLFLELRHEGWYADPESNKKVFDLMERLGVGAVITDAAGRRDCVHMRLTTPSAFIRFVGNGLHPTDYTRVDDWVNRIRSWSEKGLESLYFFMHQEDEIHSPELGRYVIQQINNASDAGMPVPEFIR